MSLGLVGLGRKWEGKGGGKVRELGGKVSGGEEEGQGEEGVEEEDTVVGEGSDGSSRRMIWAGKRENRLGRRDEAGRRPDETDRPRCKCPGDHAPSSTHGEEVARATGLLTATIALSLPSSGRARGQQPFLPLPFSVAHLHTLLLPFSPLLAFASSFPRLILSSSSLLAPQ